MAKRLTDAEARKVIRQYQHGDPIRTLAERYGVSYGNLHRVLTLAKVEMRPRGGSH